MTTAQTTRRQRLQDAAESVAITLPPTDHEDYEHDITEATLRLAERVEDYHVMSCRQTGKINSLIDELNSLKAAYARAENTVTNVVDENKRLHRQKRDLQEEVFRYKDRAVVLEDELLCQQDSSMDTTCRPAEASTDESTFPPRSTTLKTEVATVTFTRDGATLTITVTALPSILKGAVAGVIDAVEVIP